MKISVTRECAWPTSPRARQLEAMFDVPAKDRHHLQWSGDAPIEERPWSIGLIVGPSGCGKSTLLAEMFGATTPLSWTDRAVVDDFPAEFGMDAISEVCQAVGFNTVPSWLRPYSLLSNGERFRVELARRLIEGARAGNIVAIDEFTSVVDRQVARIGAHAAQKWTRRHEARLVAATCHYDVADWLLPDWLLHPAEMRFEWLQPVRLRRRPPVHCVVGALPYAAWKLFAPYHYLTADLHRSARCYGLWADGRLAAFAGCLYRPHPRARDIWGLSRLVTLPDWQGLGLAFVLADALGSALRTLNYRFHTYPAHPALIRAFDRSPKYQMIKRPGVFSPTNPMKEGGGMFGGRPNATFLYVGDPMSREDALRLWGT